MTLSRTQLVDLPTEILRDIIDFLPHKRVYGKGVDPRPILPKTTISNIASTSRRLRNLMLPKVYSSIILRRAVDVSALAEVAPFIGHFIKKLTIRWDFGGELKFHCPLDDGKALASDLATVLVNTVKLETLVLDFPGAFAAISTGLDEALASNEVVLERLHTIRIRNGQCYFYPPDQFFLLPLSRLPALQSLTLQGNCTNDDIVMSSSGTVGHSGELMWKDAATIAFPNTRFIFPSMTHLDVSSLAGFTDELLRHLLLYGGRAVDKLAVTSCPMITLNGMVKTLDVVGPNLDHLDLTILKHGNKDELEESTREEHLCPVIRERCTNLKILSVHTNKLCDELFFGPTAAGGHVLNNGLITPPDSPETIGLDVTTTYPHPLALTPPLTASESTLAGSHIHNSNLLPAPLYPVKSMPPMTKLCNVSLRIPYDYSSLVTQNTGGPSLQQLETKLCDGKNAEELLRFTERAMEMGMIKDVAKVTGWSKFGPHMLFKE